MTFCGGPLLWSLLGVKRTSLFAMHLSAFDPKRTFDSGTLISINRAWSRLQCLLCCVCREGCHP